jgi:phosphatidylglycerophosphate synthase
MIKNIPNFITLSRAVFAGIFISLIFYAFNSAVSNAYLIICFCAVIVSDVADGRLARKLNAVSAAGAKLDAAVDFIYVFGALGALAWFKKVPVWFLAVLIFSFLVFVITSKPLAHSLQSRPVFDSLGKTAASFTMALPGVFVFRCAISDYTFIIRICIFVITPMFLISSFNRLSRDFFESR